MNILIIDDSIVDCKIVSKVIQKGLPGTQIIENLDGLKIIPLVIINKIHLIILDIMLPYGSGLAILKELKENDKTKNIPVIVCSGKGDDDTIKKTLALGAYDYFEKPLSDRAVKFSLALKVKNALELVEHSEKINYLRDHDQVSQLYTRRYFESELYRYNDPEHYPLTYMMIDIDGLKIINDAYGRQTGDLIIKEIGTYLLGDFKDLHCAARWGSDEFILLLSHYGPHECESLIKSLKEYLYEKTHKFSGINISYGYAIKQEKTKDALPLLQEAEEHLYSNKLLVSSSVRGELLESITTTLHEKNPREECHSRRVSEICEQIAIQMGFSQFEVKKVKVAGLMHDIGKIIVAEHILNKPGKLNHDEWQEVKKHPQMGYKILSASKDTMDLANAVLTHHERYDGKGYPQNLKGEEIPLLGRIISVADAYDAMTGPRTYKEVLSREAAIEEIKRNSGTQFDPSIVEAFLSSWSSEL